jgi:hypothetical protein
MKTLHPKRMYTPPRGSAGGSYPPVGSRGDIPLAGGSGGKRAPDRGSWGEAPEGNISL